MNLRFFILPCFVYNGGDNLLHKPFYYFAKTIYWHVFFKEEFDCDGWVKWCFFGGDSSRCILDLLLILFEMTPFFFFPVLSWKIERTWRSLMPNTAAFVSAVGQTSAQLQFWCSKAARVCFELGRVCVESHGAKTFIEEGLHLKQYILLNMMHLCKLSNTGGASGWAITHLKNGKRWRK